ncbi:MAG: MarR family winged helix-turn-helix transcriptional regulator [Xanthobacter sp.]
MKDPFTKTISYRLNHTARLQRAFSARLLADLGLFPGQETVLKLLADQDGRTMGDLATALRVRPPTASKTVARLTTQGLVERRTSDGDGRIVRVYLTDQGRERSGSIDGIWDLMEEEITAGLDGKERKRLRKLLRKVEKNLAARLGTDDGDEDDADAGDEDDDI